MSTTTAKPRPSRQRRRPDWATYAAGSRVDHFAHWTQTHCIQSVDQFAGKPLVLEPFQLEFMGEALAVDVDGYPFWRIVILILPRKGGKTTLSSAYAVYHVDTEDGRPRVQLAASSEDQASELFDGAVAFIRDSSYLSQLFHIRDYIGEIARVDGRGVIERMTAEWRRAHGPNPSRVVPDELHTWTTRSHRRFWAGLITGDAARRDFQVFGITTAGEAADRERSILGQLLDRNENGPGNQVVRPRPGLTISRDFEARVLIYNYSAPIAGHKTPRDLRMDVKTIKLANPASWVTIPFLKAKAADPALSDAEFLQLHGCVWAEGEDVYIRRDDWAALAAPDAGGPLEFVEPGRVVALGADGSRSHDTTVVAWASPADDGYVDVDARVFSVRRDAPHHELHPSGRIDYERVEDFMLECFSDYQVAEAAYDPRYLERSADILTARLDEDCLAAVEPSSKHMRDALSAFHRAVIDGRVRHRGDPVLAAHIAACKGTLDEKGWIVRKRDHARPIDAVIAMALAYWRAELLDDYGDAGVDFGDDELEEDVDEYSDIYDDEESDE
jgi:phage terminase large subunit-like protein